MNKVAATATMVPAVTTVDGITHRPTSLCLVTTGPVEK